MQRYFVDGNYSDRLTLSSADSHHIKNVMRMNVSDKIEVVLDGRLFLYEIATLDNNVVVEKVEELNNDVDLKLKVSIAQALVNEQKMDYILQKSCELGVYSIIPLNTTRSVVKIDGKEEKKINRWKKIVKEASEQSKRVSIPKISKVLDIDELIKLDYDLKILCSVNEMTTSIKKVLSNVGSCDRILFVIGPEGGFTKPEERKLIDNGFISVSFGKTVLRTETASIFIMSIINYILME